MHRKETATLSIPSYWNTAPSYGDKNKRKGLNCQTSCDSPNNRMQKSRIEAKERLDPQGEAKNYVFNSNFLHPGKKKFEVQCQHKNKIIRYQIVKHNGKRQVWNSVEAIINMIWEPEYIWKLSCNVKDLCQQNNRHKYTTQSTHSWTFNYLKSTRIVEIGIFRLSVNLLLNMHPKRAGSWHSKRWHPFVLKLCHHWDN